MIAMLKPRLEGKFRLFLIFIVSVLLLGCATKVKVKSGVFPQVSAIEEKMQRGISTKMDVRRVLGAPTGLGSALFPTDPHPREIWYYDDIEASAYKAEKGGVLRVDVRQQILLVFFKDGVFDGFMWTSNSGTSFANKP
jgi:outer membrane protein assembly factor BamE (lipoprotein component of BamABCDE complex)